jgi:hypothetical protein
VIAALTLLSGIVVAVRMYETLRRAREGAAAVESFLCCERRGKLPATLSLIKYGF